MLVHQATNALLVSMFVMEFSIVEMVQMSHIVFETKSVDESTSIRSINILRSTSIIRYHLTKQ